MKKLLAVSIIMVLAVTTMVGCGKTKRTSKGTVKKDTLIMATNAEFPPYEYRDGDDIVGIDVEIAEAIAKELGLKLQIDDMAFDSIITAVSVGKTDIGIAGMTVTKERLQNINFSDSYATGIQAIIVKEDSDIQNVDDLFAEGTNYTIGVQTGTTGDIYCSEDAEDAGRGVVEKYNKGADAVLALTTGKIDCVVIDKQPAIEFVKANDGLKILDNEYAIEDYAICIAKGNDTLTDNINAALKKLKADGTLQAIIDKYIKAE